MAFWKGRQKENKKEQNRKKRRILKTGLLGEQNRNNSLQSQENSLFRPFYKTKEQKHRGKEQNHQKNKNTFARVGKQHPIFGKFLFISTYTLLFLQSCVLLKTL